MTEKKSCGSTVTIVPRKGAEAHRAVMFHLQEMEDIMWKEKVGSRAGRYTLAVLGLAFAGMVVANSGGVATSVALASEENVAVASIFPSFSERVSPFLATPALNALRRYDPVEADCDGASSPEELFRFENYSDTEWWIYTGSWAYDRDLYPLYQFPGVWNCIKYIGLGLEKTSVDWFWYLYESDGQTPLASCFAFSAPIIEYVWSYPYGGGCALNYWDYFDYECVGDEEFHLYIKFNGESNYTGPLINDDGPYYGCALG